MGATYFVLCEDVDHVGFLACSCLSFLIFVGVALCDWVVFHLLSLDKLVRDFMVLWHLTPCEVGLLENVVIHLCFPGSIPVSKPVSVGVCVLVVHLRSI